MPTHVEFIRGMTLNYEGRQVSVRPGDRLHVDNSLAARLKRTGNVRLVTDDLAPSEPAVEYRAPIKTSWLDWPENAAMMWTPGTPLPPNDQLVAAQGIIQSYDVVLWLQDYEHVARDLNIRLPDLPTDLVPVFYPHFVVVQLNEWGQELVAYWRQQVAEHGNLTAGLLAAYWHIKPIAAYMPAWGGAK